MSQKIASRKTPAIILVMVGGKEYKLDAATHRQTKNKSLRKVNRDPLKYLCGR